MKKDNALSFILAFIFTFTAVIMVMVVIAFKTFTGIVEEKTHANELEFAKVYAASLKQSDDALKAKLLLKSHNQILTIEVKTELDYKLVATIGRAADSKDDLLLECDKIADNIFEAKLPQDIANGAWEIMVIAICEDGRKYSFCKKFLKEYN